LGSIFASSTTPFIKRRLREQLPKLSAKLVESHGPSWLVALDFYNFISQWPNTAGWIETSLGCRFSTKQTSKNVYPRALALMGSGKINLKPLISRTFEFRDRIEPFDFALKLPPDCVKAQIQIVSQ
jgi:hypothetical protein